MSGKSRPSQASEADQLRELIREAHAAEKDLRNAVKEVRRGALAEIVAEIKGHLRELDVQAGASARRAMAEVAAVMEDLAARWEERDQRDVQWMATMQARLERLLDSLSDGVSADIAVSVLRNARESYNRATKTE